VYREDYEIRNIFDIEKIEKITLKDRIKEKSTFELIEKGANLNPDATAISFIMDGKSYEKPLQINYDQFLKKIRQTANMLHDLGVGPTDVVTYLLPNLVQTHYVLWGAEAVGIANPVNPMLEADTLKDICNAVGTKVLVALGESPGTDIWQKVEQIRSGIPSLKHVVRIMGPSNTSENIWGFDETIERYTGDKLDFDREYGPEDIASIYHTGGTTGRPKLARRTHHNEIVMAWDIQASSGLQSGEAVMVGLPLFHANGTLITGLMPFSIGGHVIILSPSGFRDTTILSNFYKIVAHFKPVFFSCVPTVLSVLLDIQTGKVDISSLRYLICGAAPLSVELFKRFEDYTGMKILEGYGLTESAVASCVNPKDGERKIGSVGIRMVYQKVKVAVLDDHGNYLRDANTDEIGVVCINGPCVFKGYVEEIHNKGIWIQRDWFNTGDLGRQDKDGFLWLTGRQKDLIIRGGHNIDPETIEEPLYKMKGLNMVAAIGRPDAHAGEVPIAYVEVNEKENITEKDVMEWAAANIGEKAAVPKEIIITKQIPLTAIGKIFKPALRWDAIKRMFEKELNALGDIGVVEKISVGEHKKHGTCASIMIKPGTDVQPKVVKDRVSQILSKYSIYYEVTC